MKQQKIITISMEEYKELLIIKGKYEELKSYTTPYIYPTKITWRGDTDTTWQEPYTVSCASYEKKTEDVGV